MNFWFLTIEFLEGMLAAAIWFWPGSLLAIFVLIFAVIWTNKGNTVAIGNSSRFLALTYIFPLLVVLCALLLRYNHLGNGNWEEPEAWRLYTIYFIGLLHVIFIILLLVPLAGRRLRALMLTTPGLWLTVCAMLPAGFFITGIGP
jgi:hypothetical protein